MSELFICTNKTVGAQFERCMIDERHPPHKYCPQCKQWRDADDTHCSKCGTRLVLKRLNEPDEVSPQERGEQP